MDQATTAMATQVQMAMPTKTLHSFPLQRTKDELDWAVFMYLFVFATVVGSTVLYRVFVCYTARSDRDDDFV